MDEEMLKQFDDEEIQNIIKKKAPGGIKFGEKSKVEVDASYAKRVPHLHGLDSGMKQLSDNSPESKTKKIHFKHTDARGIVHDLDVNVGLNITPDLEQKFKKLCEKHSDLFFEDEDFFPYLLDKNGKPFLHRLNLREDAVIRSNPVSLKLPPDHQDALSKAIKAKLRNNTFVKIPRNEQSYCNPLSVVPKSSVDKFGNKKWRLVQSLVNISENSLFINFKLECPRELLEKIPTDAKYYHFFDSVSSFDSLLLHQDDVKFTGFMAPDPSTQGKTFEIFGCSRMPQGHLNGSPNLVKTYNEIYKDCIQEGLAVYCDDFACGHNSQIRLFEFTKKIFEISSKARVRFSPLKSFWFVMSGIFCGLQLKAGALTVPAKYAAKVQDCQKPTNKSQLQRFIGLVNYTRSFIPDYSKHAEVLISVMNKLDDKGKMVWGEPQNVAFDMLQKNILNPLSLYSIDYYAKGSSLHMYFDSSKGSRAGCLFQKLVNEDGTLKDFKLIDYFSQTIPAAQKWSSILRNEWMALISCSDIWHRFLLIPSMEKYIYTDSKALWLMTRHRCRNPRIFEFINSLKSIYSPISFVWKKSEDNFADIFTRPDKLLMCDDGIKDKVLEIFNIGSEFDHLDNAIGDDKDKRKLFNDIKTLTHPDFFGKSFADSKSVLAVMTRSATKNLESPQIQEIMADELSTDSEDEILVTNPGRIGNLKNITRPKRETLDLSRDRMFKEIGSAMHQTTKTPLERAKKAHKTLHIQRTKLLELFDITKNDADDIIKNCENCTKYQSPNKHVQVKKRSYRKPLGPGVEGSMDVIQIANNCYFLGVRDNFSSFLRLQPVTNLREETIYDALMKMFLYGGIPITLKIDGASYFVGKHFKARMADRSVFLKTIAVANSNANGIERLWRMVRDYLKRSGTSWNSIDTIADMLLFINTVGQKITHDGKSYSPFELQFGVKPYLDRILQTDIPDRDYLPIQTDAVYEKISKDYNAKIPPIKSFDNFKIGMKVRYKRYGVKNPELMCGTIVSVDKETVTLKNYKGNLISRHMRDVVV